MTKTKIWAGVSLFLFFALVVSVITSALVIRSQSSNSLATPIAAVISSTTPAETLPTKSSRFPSVSLTPTPTPAPTPVSKPAIILTVAEIAKHNDVANCWTIISGQVYNLTSFADLHSGGPQAIRGTCGVDSTTAFFNRHGTRELNILARYLIGAVGQTISATPAGQATQTTSPARTPGGFNWEEDG